MKLARGFAVLSLLTGAAVAQTNALTAVRHWSRPDSTRIAIELTGPSKFRADRLAHPDRLFFDFEDTRPQLRGGKHHAAIEIHDRFVERIRVAETQRGIARLVLDLAGTGEHFTTTRLENPDRLIIEVRASAPQVARRTPAVVLPAIPEPAPPPNIGTIVTAPVGIDIVLFSASAHSIPPPPLRRRTPTPIVLASARTPDIANSHPVPARRPASQSARESMTRVLGLKIRRVVIDAGHGGHDTGSIGPTGLMEKDVVLDIAERVGALVAKRLGADVVYTRSDDVFVPLRERTAIANDKQADLFLSIHANSSDAHSAAGVETYYLSFTDSRPDLAVAARENASSDSGVFELQDMLHKIALQDKVEESREFANRIQRTLYPVSLRSNSRARDRGVRKAPFVVLIGATMPSVLAEIGFISNPHDEALMRRVQYRQHIAEALYKGLASYANSLSHMQVAQSR